MRQGVNGSSVLLVVSADVQEAHRQVSAGLSPRRDFLELAHVLGADLLDRRAVQADAKARLLDRFIRRGVGHAWAATRFLNYYDAIFSDGEHIGLPLGLLLRGKRNRPRHTMIGHGISAWKKRIFGSAARDGIDALIVHCSSQLDFAVRKLSMDVNRVYLMNYQVDVDFWEPQAERQELTIVSCGLEHRDYGSLVKAVAGLPMGVSIAAMSNWSRDRNRLAGRRLPSNVTVSEYEPHHLRELYAQARFVVVPLRDNIYPAGIATILEAMAMAKAVIVTKTRGQRETVVGPLWGPDHDRWPAEGPTPEESTGIYVPPGDVGALRAAIVYLLQRPEVAATLGRRGRLYVEQDAALGDFVRRVAGVVDPASAGSGDVPRELTKLL